MAQRKRILIVAPDVNHGLIWQRLHVPLTQLSPDYYDIRALNWEDVRNVDMHYTDILVTAHASSDEELKFLVKAKQAFGLKIVLDLDDLLTELPTDYEGMGLGRHAVAHLIQLADHMVYSTEYLKNKFSHLNPNFTVIENTIDCDRYKAVNYDAPHRTSFTVGWTGSQFHKADQYATFVDALDQFLIKNPDARAKFHVCCPDVLYRKHGTQIVFEPQPVPHLDYATHSLGYNFDVALVGLDEHEYNNAKSDLKLLEMAAIKVPIIASPRADFIRHKERDIMMYAESSEAWYAQLEWAKANVDKLRAIGERAHQYVKEYRHPSIAKDKWDKVLLGL